MNAPAARSSGSHLVLLLLLITASIGVGLWINRSAVPDEQIKETVITTLQQEADTTVFVTGYLEISTNLTLQDTRHFPTSNNLPWYAIPLFRAAGSPQVNLGTNETALHVPGRISYGFDISKLTVEDISVTDSDRVRIRLPELEIYSTEPYLDRLQVDTELGWARWSSSGRQLEREALMKLRSAMNRQGRRHLHRSDQPHMNTIRALEALLTPALQAAGVQHPTFEFYTLSPPSAAG